MRLEEFPGRRDGETVLVFSRRHPFFLYRAIAWPLMVLIFVLSIAIQTGFLSRVASGLGSLGFPASALAVLLIASGLVFWAVLEWTNDHYIVTTERVISIRRIYKVYEERKEAEIGRVQDVATRIPGLTGTLLGYADLHVSTAGTMGTITFPRIPEPQQVAEIILQQREVACRKKLDTTREAVRDTLEREMGIR